MGICASEQHQLVRVLIFRPRDLRVAVQDRPLRNPVTPGFEQGVLFGMDT